MKVTRDIYLLIMAPRAWMGQSVHNLSLPERNSVRYSYEAYIMKHVYHRRIAWFWGVPGERFLAAFTCSLSADAPCLLAGKHLITRQKRFANILLSAQFVWLCAGLHALRCDDSADAADTLHAPAFVRPPNVCGGPPVSGPGGGGSPRGGALGGVQ
jgi:hypothetical protein